MHDLSGCGVWCRPGGLALFVCACVWTEAVVCVFHGVEWKQDEAGQERAAAAVCIFLF